MVVMGAAVAKVAGRPATTPAIFVIAPPSSTLLLRQDTSVTTVPALAMIALVANTTLGPPNRVAPTRALR